MSISPARPLPPEVRAKAGKFLLLLSSDHPGEQVAAADALGHLLKSHGLDWHDLAAMITTAPPPAAATQPSPSPKPPPPRDGFDDDDNQSIDSDELAALIATLREHCTFDRKSEGFLDSLQDRCDRYATVFMSPKMSKWLRDLVVRAGL